MDSDNFGAVVGEYTEYCGISDSPAVPGVGSAVGILPVAMDCEENAFAGIDCEGIKLEGNGMLAFDA